MFYADIQFRMFIKELEEEGIVDINGQNII